MPLLKHFIVRSFLFLAFSSIPMFAASEWTDLFPNGSLEAWRSPRTETFPKQGWVWQDGMLTIKRSGGQESRGGGDIITRARYSNFELEFEFRITPGANSGVKFLVQPNLSPIDRISGKPTAVGSAIGLEFQILDDQLHPDARAGRDGDRTAGSLYDLIPAAKDKVVKPVGEWNRGRIIVRGSHVEFWLNDHKTLEFERHSAAFRALVEQSKYRDIPKFGEWADGHILLQDHGDEASFRKVRIRELTAQ